MLKSFPCSVWLTTLSICYLASAESDVNQLNIKCQPHNGTGVLLETAENAIDWYCAQDTFARCGVSYDADHKNKIFLVWQVIASDNNGTCRNCSTVFHKMITKCRCFVNSTSTEPADALPRSDQSPNNHRKCDIL